MKTYQVRQIIDSSQDPIRHRIVAAKPKSLQFQNQVQLESGTPRRRFRMRTGRRDMCKYVEQKNSPQAFFFLVENSGIKKQPLIWRRVAFRYNFLFAERSSTTFTTVFHFYGNSVNPRLSRPFISIWKHTTVNDNNNHHRHHPSHVASVNTNKNNCLRIWLLTFTITSTQCNKIHVGYCILVRSLECINAISIFRTLYVVSG